MNSYVTRFTSSGKDGEFRSESPGPVQALDKFHRHMQTVLGFDRDKYSITSHAHVYSSDPTGRGLGDVIESNFDLPRSENPQLKKQPVIATPDTEAMGFLGSGAGL